jgi:hypothetical protein
LTGAAAVSEGFAAVRDRPNEGNLQFVQARFQFDFY